MAVLETSMTSRARENVEKTPKNDKKHVKKVLLVAQELKLARVLAGNNKTARDRAVKSLKKWFQSRSTTIPFTEDDFLRLWKGLFYSMWMSDKPLIQEECAENISNLVHSLPLETSLLFFKCGMTILMNEWFGIDQLRLDKFLMFVRRLLRQCLFVLKNENWTKSSIKKFVETLSETILDTETEKPTGLLMHFTEIYLEELAKVSGGNLAHLMTEFLGPFMKQLAFTDDYRIIDHIKKHIFLYLIRQSDLGLDYEEKYKAWKNLGFPGSIDSMKKMEISDEETDEKDVEATEEASQSPVFDPRAGRIDVELPQLKFYPKSIAKALSEYKVAKATNLKSRKCLTELSEHFKKMASGIYPLGVKRIKLAKDEYDTNVKKAAKKLIKFDQKIKGNKNKRKHRNENEIELRGGKKIKLNERLSEKIANELNHVILKQEKRKKRKLPEPPVTPVKKVKKQEEEEEEKGIFMELECSFIRNSGTWFVTKSVLEESDKEESFQEDCKQSEEKVKHENSVGEAEAEDNNIFPKNDWEEADEGVVENMMVLPGKYDEVFAEKILNMVKKNKNLLKNPFATQTKKVKINTSLNRSQEIDEHQAQIKSSPAIPYDANRKPSKPLLKSTTLKSPINPFYTIINEERTGRRPSEKKEKSQILVIYQTTFVIHSIGTNVMDNFVNHSLKNI